MTNALKDMIRLKRAMYKKVERAEPSLTARYFQLGMEVKNYVRNANRTYEIRIVHLARDDPKASFRYII